MSYVSPDLSALLRELGWRERYNPDNAAELILGDYARGFLILRLPQEIQVAQRPLRGGPSLKMRTNDFGAAEKYVAFYAARLLRFRRRLTDSAVPVDPATVADPFTLVSDPLRCALLWDQSWAEFGVGNDFAAVQFSHYARGDVGDTISRTLS